MHAELGRCQVEVQRCTLSWAVGKELGQELARRKLRWKLMQTWSRRRRRRRRKRRRSIASRGGRRRRRRRRTTLIKSNNPHLAGGEILPAQQLGEGQITLVPWCPLRKIVSVKAAKMDGCQPFNIF